MAIWRSQTLGLQRCGQPLVMYTCTLVYLYTCTLVHLYTCTLRRIDKTTCSVHVFFFNYLIRYNHNDVSGDNRSNMDVVRHSRVPCEYRLSKYKIQWHNIYTLWLDINIWENVQAPEIIQSKGHNKAVDWYVFSPYHLSATTKIIS